MLVLLAEDEHDISRIYSIQLQSQGHQILTVADGERCIELYRMAYWQKCLRQKEETRASEEICCRGTDINRPPFDAVILDYRMPKKDGLMVAADILKLAPEQRIIFVSAYVKEFVEKPVRQLKADIEVFQKPVSPRTLVEVVEDKALYEEIERLGGNAKKIREEMNPTHRQLKQLVESMRKLRAKYES
ncbi:response regulator [Candidatus Nitrososphaera gargensis]|nr:response regulator [Candidatus Nitrososphaera gargensis]